MRTLLADAVLVFHFAFVVFVVGGFALIWLGAVMRWRWIRDMRFRIAHLAAISFVALESVAGMMCPLTVWEDALRGRESELGFVARWVHAIMFYDLPAWIFTALYLGFALAIVATWWLIPPTHMGKPAAAG